MVLAHHDACLKLSNASRTGSASMCLPAHATLDGSGDGPALAKRDCALVSNGVRSGAEKLLRNIPEQVHAPFPGLECGRESPVSGRDRGGGGSPLPRRLFS